MARRKGRSAPDSVLPWWLGVVLAVGSWFGIVLFLPEAVASLPVAGRRLAAVMERIAWVPATVVAGLLLISAAGSWRKGQRKRRLLDSRNGIASIRSLSWREFEELVAEAFRREGYRVVENSKAGADGGVDVRLRKDGKLFVVQCKNWNRNKVGVGVVREMCGVMMGEGAGGVIIVCSGHFTHDAREFARDKPVRLVDGRTLVALVARVRR